MSSVCWCRGGFVSILIFQRFLFSTDQSHTIEWCYRDSWATFIVIDNNRFQLEQQFTSSSWVRRTRKYAFLPPTFARVNNSLENEIWKHFHNFLILICSANIIAVCVSSAENQFEMRICSRIFSFLRRSRLFDIIFPILMSFKPLHWCYLIIEDEEIDDEGSTWEREIDAVAEWGIFPFYYSIWLEFFSLNPNRTSWNFTYCPR